MPVFSFSRLLAVCCTGLMCILLSACTGLGGLGADTDTDSDESGAAAVASLAVCAPSRHYLVFRAAVLPAGNTATDAASLNAVIDQDFTIPPLIVMEHPDGQTSEPLRPQGPWLAFEAAHTVAPATGSALSQHQGASTQSPDALVSLSLYDQPPIAGSSQHFFGNGGGYTSMPQSSLSPPVAFVQKLLFRQNEPQVIDDGAQRIALRLERTTAFCGLPSSPVSSTD